MTYSTQVDMRRTRSSHVDPRFSKVYMKRHACITSQDRPRAERLIVVFISGAFILDWRSFTLTLARHVSPMRTGRAFWFADVYMSASARRNPWTGSPIFQK